MDGQVFNSQSSGSSVIVTSPEPKRRFKVRSDATDRCPTCGDKLIFQGGCCQCMSCGFAKCG